MTKFSLDLLPQDLTNKCMVLNCQFQICFRPRSHGTVCVYAQYAYSKKYSVHMHLFHLTCLFKRDRWKRCSTYAATVSGAVTSTKIHQKQRRRAAQQPPPQCCHGYPSVHAPQCIQQHVVHVILHVHLLLMVVVEELYIFALISVAWSVAVALAVATDRCVWRLLVFSGIQSFPQHMDKCNGEVN